MEKLPVIFWVLAYTLTGADILLGLVTYIQKKDKKVSAFLLLLLNIFAITLISFLYSLSILGDFLFAVFLQNGLMLLYIVLPNLLFKMDDIQFKSRGYFIFTALLFVSLNILTIFKIPVFPYFYIICWIPFLISGLKLYREIKELGVVPPDKGNPLYFYRSLKSAWNMTGIVAAIMGLSSLSFYFFSSVQNGVAYSLYFAVFYCFYSLPSLIYFSRQLFFVRSEVSALDDLTEREKEVARLIIDGKKYREIGDELFISLSTVKKHANNIYRKTGTTNGRELIRYEINSRKS